MHRSLQDVNNDVRIVTFIYVLPMLQVDPVQPASHAHVLGATQRPFAHGLVHTGVEQLASLQPALHVQMPGMAHVPC
jgi:hypothetical protein